MKKWIPIVLFSLSSLHNAAVARPSIKVSDSLVKDLSCSDLSVDKIYSAIRPEALSAFYHIPVENWGFYSGGPELGVCWSLSSAQRKLFYLARFQSKEDLSKPELRRKTLNLLRNYELEPEQQGHGRERFMPTPLGDLEVLRFADRSMRYSWGLEDKVPNGMFPLLNRGYEQSILGAGERVWKTFMLDIQRSQQQHFFRGTNIAMAVNGVRANDVAENMATMALLEKNLNSNRLTLLNLRISLGNQHVVVAKEIMPMKNMKAIIVYDSNHPDNDNILYFDTKDKTFHAPAIFSTFKDVRDPSTAIGVFVVDEQERGPIEKAMLTYYQDQCKNQ